MNQKVRVTLFSVLITTFLSIGIGFFSLQDSRNGAIGELDSDLNLVIQTAQENPNDTINAALFAIENSKLDASLLFLTPSMDMTVIVESTLLLRDGPSAQEIKTSSVKPITVNADSPYRLRSLTLPEGEYLLVAASIAELDSTWHTNLLRIVIFLFFANALAILFSILVLRNNSRNFERNSLSRMQLFLGDAAHELRTPLTVIKGYSELLASKKFDAPEDRERALLRIDTEVKRMESLINDLLLTAELSESTHLDFSECDLTELLATHIQDFKVLSPAHEVTSLIEDGVKIQGSIDHLERLIQNIFSNIRRHTSDEVDVKISLKKIGKNAVMTFEDAGPGLPPEAYKKSILEFERFDRSRSRLSGGSGLGMSIMAAVVKEHRGALELSQSDLGGLSTKITLPIK